MRDYIKVSCPDNKCEDGYILVYNAYSENPFKGQKQICDTCNGKSFVWVLRKDTLIN